MKPYENLEQRAESLAQAGKMAPATRFYCLAGERSVAGGDYEAALDYYSRALALVPDVQRERRYDLLRQRIFVLGRLGRYQAQEIDLVSFSTIANDLDDDQRRAEVGAAIAEYKFIHGDFRDAISISQLALRLAQIANATREIVLLEQIWGQAHLRQGDYLQAKAKLQSALDRARALKWPQATANSLRFLGIFYLEQGDCDRARSHYEEALSLYNELADQPGQAEILNNLGNVAHAQGDFSGAEAYWEEAAPIYEAIGDRRGLCRILTNRSAVFTDVGFYDQARNAAEMAVAIAQSVALKFGEALALTNLSSATNYLGDLKGADEAGQAALALAQAMGSRRLEGYALLILGRVHGNLGKRESARDYYWQSVALWQELNQRGLEMESRAGLVEIALAGGKVDTVRTDLTTIHDYLQDGLSIDGTDSPFNIYLSCYRGLAADNDGRASAVLKAAHKLLQVQAAAIADEAIRSSFLHQVAAHRDLIAHFKANAATA